MLPSGRGFSIFITFHPAAWRCRDGSEDLPSASPTLVMICSNAAVLSGLIATVHSATSPWNVSLAGCASFVACAPAGCATPAAMRANADKTLSIEVIDILRDHRGTRSLDGAIRYSQDFGPRPR